MTRTHIPALDGVRGLAVLLVLAFHAEISGFGGGFLGVSVFFTLSGFLITSLLLTELAETGGVRLGRFWAKRARRLLPAALLCLLVVARFAKEIGPELTGAVLYVANWQQLSAGNEYASLFETAPPLVHFWSLAIEEQFYLLWPLLLWGLSKLAGARRGPLLALCVGLSAGVWGYVHAGGSGERVYLGTETRAVEILAGAALALAVQWWGAPRSRWWGAVATGCTVMLLTLVVITDTETAWVYRGGLPLFSLLSVGVLVGALRGGVLARVLSTRGLRACGQISYGLYLYHWPVFVAIGTDTAARLAASVTLTALAAVISYVVIERPIRNGAVSGRVLVPAAAAVTGLLLLGPGRAGGDSATRDPDCFYGDTCSLTGPAPRYEAGGRIVFPDAPGDRLRIAVVGDSVAQVTAYGLRHSDAAGRNQVEVLGAGVAACPLVGTEYRWSSVKAGKWNQDCDTSRSIELLRAYQPDVVVVAYTLANQAELRIDGRWSSIDDPDTQATMYRAMVELVEAARTTGAVVWWADTPAFPHASTLFSSSPDRVAAHNALIDRLLEEHPDVRRLPLAAQYKDLPPEMFVDGVHLHMSAAVRVANESQVPGLLASSGADAGR